MGTDLTDDDVECNEGRQIVFVDPRLIGELDLTASARIALQRFLESEDYRRILSTLESTRGDGRNA